MYSSRRKSKRSYRKRVSSRKNKTRSKRKYLKNRKMRGGGVISDYGEFYRQWKECIQRITSAAHDGWDPSIWEKKFKDLEQDNPGHLEQANKQLKKETDEAEAESEARKKEEQRLKNEAYERGKNSAAAPPRTTWGTGFEF